MKSYRMTRIYRIFFGVFLFPIFIPPLSGSAQELIKKGETLSLAKCVQIGIEKHPDIEAAMSTADAIRARIGQARANYYPQIGWTSDVSRTAVGSRTSSGFVTGAATYNSYSTGITLNQNILDFGKTATQVKIQSLDYDASRSDLETETELIVFNVKQAYFGVLQALRNRDIASEAVKQFQLHLDQAKGFYEVGTVPKYDVTKAEVDLSNARLNLIKAQNSIRLAFAALNNGMGVPDAPEYQIEDNLSFEKYEIAFEDALARAYQNRPDLKSMTAKRQAGESSITLAKKGFLPQLAGTAGYDFGGYSFPLQRGWNIGMTLNLSLFSGFLTVYQVEESKANLKALRANEESLRQSVFLDVQQAYLNLKQAEEVIPVAELTVTQAQENYDIASGTYSEGLGDPIQVADAGIALSSAKAAHVQALYDYKVARSSLEKAMGSK
jgi:outer membrane protein TolC